MSNALAMVDVETGEIIDQRSRDLAVFDPTKTADHLIGLDAVKARAARMKDWPTMELAIAEQVDLQRDHVAWWRANVGEYQGRPRKNAGPRSFSVESAEELTGISQQQTSKWAAKVTSDEARAKYQAQLEAKARKAAGLEEADNHRAEGSGENEWYTPAEYIEAARDVMGGIDLDPASSDAAQRTVKASEYFTAQRSGLDAPWHGRVWLNPPYAQPIIQHFAEKAVKEATEGRIEQAIILTHNYTDTYWFHHIEEVASRICFTRGRIAFVDQYGDKCAPTQGQAFFYLGDQPDRFSEVFREFGFVR